MKPLLELKEMAVKTLQAKQTHVGGEGTADLNRAIVEWLKSCHRYNAAPTKELIDAVARQLKVDGRVRNRADMKKRSIAIEACLRDSTVSTNKLARVCDVSRPTIDHWRNDDSFKFEVALLKAIIDANPALGAMIEANPHLTLDEIENLEKDGDSRLQPQKLSGSPCPRKGRSAWQSLRSKKRDAPVLSAPTRP